MPEKKFELGDYVEVKDRIRILFELFPQARIETDYHLTSDPDDKPKVICRALVYRKPEDDKPAGHGTSWLYLPGSTPYTRGSEIENAETSAVGRAIGMLGILIAGGLASKQEIDNKAGESDRPEPPKASEPYVETEELTGRVRRRGIVRKGTAEGYKVDARIGPEGHVIGFRLEVGPEKHIPQCLVQGPLGEMLYLATAEHPDSLIGSSVTVSGILYHVKSNRGPSWYRLHVDRIETSDWILPADDEPALPEPPEDLQLVGEEPAA